MYQLPSYLSAPNAAAGSAGSNEGAYASSAPSSGGHAVIPDDPFEPLPAGMPGTENTATLAAASSASVAAAELPSSPPLQITDRMLFSTLAEGLSTGKPYSVSPPLSSPRKTIAEAKRGIVDRLSPGELEAALLAAESRRRNAEAAMVEIRRRAAEIPGQALELEARLIKSLGSVSAETHTLRIRDVSNRIRSLHASIALMHSSTTGPQLLQQWIDTSS
jgi:hypothetical protein